MKKLATIGAARSNEIFGKFDGQIDTLSGIAYTLLGFGIIAGVGILVIAQFANMTDTGGSIENADANAFLDQVVGAYSTLGDFLTVVVITLVAVMLIRVAALVGNR